MLRHLKTRPTALTWGLHIHRMRRWEVIQVFPPRDILNSFNFADQRQEDMREREKPLDIDKGYRLRPYLTYEEHQPCFAQLALREVFEKAQYGGVIIPHKRLT